MTKECSLTVGKKKYKISDEELRQLEAYAKAQEWLKLTEMLIELRKAIKEDPEILEWVEQQKQKGVYIMDIIGYKFAEDGSIAEVIFKAYEELKPEDKK